MNFVETLNRNRVDTSHNAWRDNVDPLTGLPVFGQEYQTGDYVPHFVPLPINRRSVHYELPRARGDLNALQRYSDERTCAAFSVPSFMVLGTTTSGATSGASAVGDMALTNAILPYKRLVGNTLISLFRICFETKRTIDTKTDDTAPHSAEPPMWTDVTVIFPSLLRPPAIVQLYKDEVLHYSSYVRLLAAHYDLLDQDIRAVHGRNTGDNLAAHERDRPFVERRSSDDRGTKRGSKRDSERGSDASDDSSDDSSDPEDDKERAARTDRRARKKRRNRPGPFDAGRERRIGRRNWE